MLDVKEDTPDPPVDDSEDPDFQNSANDDKDSFLQFYKAGSLELVLKGFAAQLELSVTLDGVHGGEEFTAPLPDIPIPSLSIYGGIGSAGLVFRPKVIFGFEVQTSLSFSYGFNLTVPDSSIFLDIGNPTNSSITGIQDAVFETLPFKAEVDSISLKVYAAFVPQLLIAISPAGFIEEIIDAHIDAGAFLDLPKLSATIEQVSDVDEHCAPLNISAAGTDDRTSSFKFPRLTHIVPEIEFGAGFVAEASFGEDVDAVGYPETEFAVFDRNVSLPTACFSYDANAKDYVAPTPPPGKVGKNGKGVAGDQKNSSLPLCNGQASASFIALLMVFWAMLL